MEAHRSNPVCASCHQIFEPMGIALENFDAVGKWRTYDEGALIDPTGVTTDGTRLEGVKSLRDLTRRYSDQFAVVVTEKLLTYAVGRGMEDRGHADGPRNYTGFESEELPILVTGYGRRRKQGLPDEYEIVRSGHSTAGRTLID